MRNPLRSLIRRLRVQSNAEARLARRLRAERPAPRARFARRLWLVLAAGETRRYDQPRAWLLALGLLTAGATLLAVAIVIAAS